MAVVTTVTALDGPGACHVDRIVRECIAARTPAARAHIRLIAAADFGDVLDRLETS